MIPSPKAPPSLGRRAAYAVLLMAGFYLLAFGIAAVLLYLPYAEWHYVGRVEIRLAIFSLAAAFAILAAVMPRVDAFDPPGPELTPADHPRLFSLIGEVASATHQSPPQRVYLVPEVNAWVSQRGGLMGFGSERVMGVGLPLLQTLTRPEFKAVLAHEFGHFDGGDTMLGPWIYKTRSAIGRTLEAFSTKHTWLAKPFEWYGNLFLRITHGVSRHQEYAADALAAQVVGAPALASGLKAIHAYAPLFPSFWQSEVAPALKAGYRPPIATGFRQFVASPTMAPAIGKVLEAQLTEASADPFDTHPPLRERLAALGASSDSIPEVVTDPAILLLDHPDAQEKSLLAHLLPKEVSTALKPAEWEELGSLVYIPRWRALATDNAARLSSLRTSELASLAAPPGALAVRLQLAATTSVVTERNVAESWYLIGVALALQLHDRGFRFTAHVGQPVVFDIDGVPFGPFQAMEGLSDGSLSQATWLQFLDATHISDQPLAVPEGGAPSTTVARGA